MTPPIVVAIFWELERRKVIQKHYTMKRLTLDESIKEASKETGLPTNRAEWFMWTSDTWREADEMLVKLNAVDWGEFKRIVGE